jgi:hypothetical protein
MYGMCSVAGNGLLVYRVNVLQSADVNFRHTRILLAMVFTLVCYLAYCSHESEGEGDVVTFQQITRR